jgi:hypothetical protein
MNTEISHEPGWQVPEGPIVPMSLEMQVVITDRDAARAMTGRVGEMGSAYKETGGSNEELPFRVC